MIKINETPVPSKNLIKDKVYSDVFETHRTPTLLKFVKHDEVGDPLFEHVGGKKCYGVDEDGLIPFFGSSNDWYEVENFEERK